MDLKLNDTEKEQASLPALAMEKAIIYTNDFYSWAKEKAEQATVAADQDIFNAVAILMKEYKISETDALDLLREKTLECEKEHWAAVAGLEATGPVSSNLYRYLEMTRLCHAGGMLWSALTDRYNLVGQTQVNGDLVTRTTPPIGSDMKTPAQESAPPALPNDSTSEDEKRPRTNGITFQDTNDNKSEVPVLDGNKENRFCLKDGLNGPCEIASTPQEAAKDTALAPYEYVKSMPSKKVREVLIDGLNRWLQLPEKSLDIIRNIVVMLHTAALMLDDIEDGSMLRRGLPSAHVVYGESQTINSASYVQVRAFAEAAKLSHPDAVSIFCEELENLYIGQSLDLRWKFQIHCPSEKEYLEMVDGSEGPFLLQKSSICACSELNFVKRRHETELEPFIKALGRYFQIRDDFQNIASNEVGAFSLTLNLQIPSPSVYTQQKGFCEDLDEGKLSLPLIHSLQNSSEAEKAQIMGIFRTRGSSGLLPEVKRFVMSHLSEKTASLSYVKEMLEGMEVKLADDLMALEEMFGVKNDLLQGVLAKLKV
ncbi:MAG: hypothetical protein Q9186_000035 [Xanthomendoza sp. 1 TL-2023]